MTHEHVIAFLLGACAEAALVILFEWLDARRQIRDARELRRRWAAQNIFEKTKN